MFVQILKSLVYECLQKAQKNNINSIAFPVLGSGNLNYPRVDIAPAIVSAIKKFLQSNPQTQLSDIRIIVFSNDSDLMGVSITSVS